MGDMSLVGPRPLLPCDQPDDPSGRLMVRPGITGWAQVNGGTLLTPAEKNVLDEWYIENATFMLDVKIAYLSVLAALRGPRRLSHQGSARYRALRVGKDRRAGSSFPQLR